MSRFGCDACGVAWTDHKGIEPTCREAKEWAGQVAALTAENERLREALGHTKGRLLSGSERLGGTTSWRTTEVAEWFSEIQRALGIDPP